MQVTFKADTGSYVTNLISETAEGSMLLTFTFSFPLPKDLTPGSEAEAAKKKEIYEMAGGAVGGSLRTMLEVFETGTLN
jgi:hexokinase